MKKLSVAVSILVLTCFSAPALAQNSRNGEDGTILLGRHYSFILKEPAGWVIDGSAAKSQDVDAVLYREGSSWKDAVAVMYARVIEKDQEKATIERVITEDVNDFLKQSRESKILESPALETRDKKRAIVRGFYDAANKNYESVAFIDEPKVVVILALSSRNEDEFEKSLQAFKSLVGSYFFVKELVQAR
jgi:hypothetical protein